MAQTKKLECSFCGKGQKDARIVAGPSVAICEECVELVRDILAEQKQAVQPAISN